jgi:hypothetical protein
VPSGDVVPLPRFFFHMTDGERTFTDAIGIELESLVAARRHITFNIGELRSALYKNGVRNLSEWAVIIFNEKNEILQEVYPHLIPRI